MTGVILVLLLFITLPCSYASQAKNRNNYVEDACSVTRYRNLCIRTLASFSNTAKHNPSIWARAGVSVTIGEAKKVSKYLATNKIALSDCIESFQDTLDNLHRSLFVLRKLSILEFTSQLEDVITWVSAALTDEDTCLDGFYEQKGNHVKFLTNRVSNVTYMTSNALAIVNKLATTGPECLTN
ncbi:Pectinesterase [Handroanthus impetiginosus]|uniref:Pectinesterase n=1 Tax=Handroanthus impetiginosus TaxID=429701 RepID=A0A2G9G2V9_9LAMI|nr:Pectinesterase [Handroanthus impetiginosus]